MTNQYNSKIETKHKVRVLWKCYSTVLLHKSLKSEETEERIFIPLYQVLSWNNPMIQELI